MKNSRKILALLLSVVMLLGVLPMTAVAAETSGMDNFKKVNTYSADLFSDVSDSDWFVDNVKTAYELGLMIGQGKQFGVASYVTIAETVTLAARLHSIYYGNSDSLVQESPWYRFFKSAPWYQVYVDYVSSKNLVSLDGLDMTAPATRAQFASILAASLPAEALERINNVADNAIPDVSIEDDCAEAVYALYRAGVLIGNNSEGKFAPESNIKRNEVAAVVTRMADASLRKSITLGDFYTVTFDLNYTNAPDSQVVFVESGKTVPILTRPARSGYSFIGWFTAPSGGKKFDFNTTIADEITLYAHWDSDDAPVAVKYYTVTFVTEGSDSPVEIQKIKSGEYIAIPKTPERVGYYFVGWSLSGDIDDLFQGFQEGITKDITLYACWINENDTGDMDGDDLPDYLENALHTDKQNADSDGDGLTDYQEIYDLGTDPLLADSDANGITDDKEDFDGDTLENKYEYTIGTSPVLNDSDFDGLNDEAELSSYRTNPINFDTDGDGATDGQEVLYGTDPLVFNASFEDHAESAPISEYNSVSVNVVADVAGNQLGTIDVQCVDILENPFLSASVPGYLGQAYDLSADGDIQSATITFRYDTNLGNIGTDFAPRIYYYNSETQHLEEIPDQIVENGAVSANVTHFSTYILLNKIVFDAFWESEIILPLSGQENKDATLAFAFVIDYSASMSWNDPNQLCKELSKEFVAKLRPEKDKAAVIKFIRKATLVSDLTTDKELLTSAIDGIVYDDGYGSYSGTNGSDGLKLALDQLASADSEYKYVIFITDGEDNYSTYSYSDLIDFAVENGIVVYSVGMGSASESTLRLVANSTGGKYYHATTDVDASDLIDIDKVFDEIEAETIDLTADSNNDRIPDYYSQLIFEGKLGLGTGSVKFVGYDFNFDENGNSSDDYDGDGIINGDELIIRVDGNNVYLHMISNPTLSDSDGDGSSDLLELTLGSDPLKYSYSPGSSVDTLLENGIYCNYLLANRYDNSLALQISVNLIDLFSFNWSTTKVAKQIYLDYFNDYASDMLEQTIEKNSQKLFLENVTEDLDWVSAFIQDLSTVNDSVDIITEKLDKFYQLRGQLNTLYKRVASLSNASGDQAGRLSKLADDYIQIKTEMGLLGRLNGVPQKIVIQLSDYSRQYQHFMKRKNFTGLENSTTISLAATAFTTGVEMLNTFTTYSSVQANTIAYEENLDILAYLSTYGGRKASRDAANQIYELVQKNFVSYNRQLKEALVEDVALGVTEFLISELLAKNAYTLAIKAAYDVLDLLVGASHKAETIDFSLYMDSLTEAVYDLTESSLLAKRFAYDCRAENNATAQRYLTHLAQLRVFGENNFVDYAKNKGWITQLFDGGYNEACEQCSYAVDLIVESADSLGLYLSPSLRKLIDHWYNGNWSYGPGGGGSMGGR